MLSSVRHRFDKHVQISDLTDDQVQFYCIQRQRDSKRTIENGGGRGGREANCMMSEYRWYFQIASASVFIAARVLLETAKANTLLPTPVNKQPSSVISSP